MATYEYIKRASAGLKDQMQDIADEYSQQEDGETYSLTRSGWGHQTHWALLIEYSDSSESSELSLYQCSECLAILAEGETEEAQCSNCWAAWTD